VYPTCFVLGVVLKPGQTAGTRSWRNDDIDLQRPGHIKVQCPITDQLCRAVSRITPPGLRLPWGFLMRAPDSLPLPSV
jgi:hypothetical protein